MNMEEIREPTQNIIDNFKLILFKSYQNLTNNNIIIKLNINNISEITSKNIKIPKILKIKVLQAESHIFELISSKISVKILLKIGIRFF